MMRWVGRNDPCPCGSGRKYKNCCMLKDKAGPLSKNRVFSFKNYQLLYGYSPFNLPVDWDAIKDADGNPAAYINGEFYSVKTVYGDGIYPRFCTRIENGSDLNAQDVVQNEDLLLEFENNRRADIMKWSYEFHMIAFLADEMNPAFALVTRDKDEPGKFNLRSEIYPVKGNLYEEIIRFFGSKGNYFPLGELTMELSCDLYIVPCWMLEAFIIEHEKIDIEYKFISEDELDEYVHNANDKSQYGPGNEGFRTLGRKYRKHCTYLMELLCMEDEMRVMHPEKVDPEPYLGDDSYIFVSYAHADKDAVYPVIAQMSQMGVRIWFDEAIAPGSEWDDNIAKHVKNCDGMIAFMSANYLQSKNCRDELNYARDLEKEHLLVYLEDIELPDGMAMRLNRIQAIKKYAYKKPHDFYNKLMQCDFVIRNKG